MFYCTTTSQRYLVIGQPSHILISCKTIQQSVQGEILRLFVLQQYLPTICLTLLNQSRCYCLLQLYCNIATLCGQTLFSCRCVILKYKHPHLRILQVITLICCGSITPLLRVHPPMANSCFSVSYQTKIPTRQFTCDYNICSLTI